SLYASGSPRRLPLFPTRRSSDLDGQRPGVGVPVAVFVHAGGGGGVHAHHKDHGVGQEGHFQQGGQQGVKDQQKQEIVFVAVDDQRPVFVKQASHCVSLPL